MGLASCSPDTGNRRLVSGYDLEAILAHLRANGYRHVVDLSDRNGCIWVLTYQPELRDTDFFAALKRRFGAPFVYRREGGRNANRNSGAAWWFNPRNETGWRWGDRYCQCMQGPPLWGRSGHS